MDIELNCDSGWRLKWFHLTEDYDCFHHQPPPAACLMLKTLRNSHEDTVRENKLMQSCLNIAKRIGYFGQWLFNTDFEKLCVLIIVSCVCICSVLDCVKAKAKNSFLKSALSQLSGFKNSLNKIWVAHSYVQALIISICCCSVMQQACSSVIEPTWAWMSVWRQAKDFVFATKKQQQQKTSVCKK